MFKSFYCLLKNAIAEVAITAIAFVGLCLVLVFALCLAVYFAWSDLDGDSD
jgi:hypothetical protein